MGKGIDAQVEELQRLLAERLRIRGRDLARQTRKAGRLLPRRIRADLAYAEQARGLLTHPKLRLMVDEAKVIEAQARAIAFLKTVDPGERRKTRLLGMAGVVSFNLIVIAAAFIVFLVWRGYV